MGGATGAKSSPGSAMFIVSRAAQVEKLRRSDMVRLRAHWNSRVKVPDLADTVGPVTESNCIGATSPGGEQLEVNYQSVTTFARMGGHSELDSVGGPGEPAM